MSALFIEKSEVNSLVTWSGNILWESRLAEKEGTAIKIVKKQHDMIIDILFFITLLFLIHPIRA
jgi:hypothetical protein